MWHDVTFYGVLAIAVVILGLSKGGFAGIGMISTPLVAMVSDPITAVGLMLPIMLVQDPVAVFLYRRSFDLRILRLMIPGAALGVLLAYWFAATVPEWGLQAALGAISVAFALWQLRGHFTRAPRRLPPAAFDGALGRLAGLACGFSSAIAHAGSPPYQIYALPRQLPKEVFVGTSVILFASVNLMKLPSYAALGLFRHEALTISALFIPLAVASSWAGALLVRRIDMRRFNLVITFILLCVGAALIAQARAGW